jgi:host factor-I protein
MRKQPLSQPGHRIGIVMPASVPHSVSHLRRSRTPPPGDTGQESLYLRSLSDRQVNVSVCLRDGEVINGWIEYFDDGMIRITRDGHPNLFIYKHQIRSRS